MQACAAIHCLGGSGWAGLAWPGCLGLAFVFVLYTLRICIFLASPLLLSTSAGGWVSETPISGEIGNVKRTNTHKRVECFEPVATTVAAGRGSKFVA